MLDPIGTTKCPGARDCFTPSPHLDQHALRFKRFDQSKFKLSVRWMRAGTDECGAGPWPACQSPGETWGCSVTMRLISSRFHLTQDKRCRWVEWSSSEDAFYCIRQAWRSRRFVRCETLDRTGLRHGIQFTNEGDWSDGCVVKRPRDWWPQNPNELCDR